MDSTCWVPEVKQARTESDPHRAALFRQADEWQQDIEAGPDDEPA
jgi:hypothetical protein